MKYNLIGLCVAIYFIGLNSYAVDLKSCQKINCRDTAVYSTKETQTQCLIKKRDCHKSFLDTRITELKKSGITKTQRDKMLRALSSAKVRSEATLKGLRAKVKITENDMADLDQKIKEVKSLPAKK